MLESKKLATWCAALGLILASSGLAVAQEAPSAAAQAAAQAVAASGVAATVNGQVISNSDVDQFLQQVLAQYGGAAQIPPQQIAMVRERIVEQLVQQEVIRQYGEKNEVKVTDEDIDEVIEGFKAQIGNDEDQFNEALSAMGMTFEELKERLREDILPDKVVRHIQESLPDPTDEEIQAFYTTNIAEFEVPESVKASHILISTDGAMTDEAKAEKMEKAKELLAEVKNGASFAAVASEHSSCPSARRGGDLGEFGRGAMVPEFEEAAFALEPGEVSDIVTTQFGYHIIQVVDAKEGYTVPMEEVREDIAAGLKGPALEAALDKLMDEAVIEIHSAGVPALPSLSPPAPTGGAQGGLIVQ